MCIPCSSHTIVTSLLTIHLIKPWLIWVDMGRNGQKMGEHQETWTMWRTSKCGYCIKNILLFYGYWILEYWKGYFFFFLLKYPWNIGIEKKQEGLQLADSGSNRCVCENVLEVDLFNATVKSRCPAEKMKITCTLLNTHSDWCQWFCFARCLHVMLSHVHTCLSMFQYIILLVFHWTE